MSHLHSGVWTGTALNSDNHQSQQVTIAIEVDQDGLLTGHVIGEGQQSNSEPSSIHGQYSTFGSVNFDYRVDEHRHALFSGRFEMPDENHGTIWGSLILVYGSGKREAGSASLQFIGRAKEQPTAPTPPPTPNAGRVWGNG